MNEEICKNCVHYQRHYIVIKSLCTPVNCGHCDYPRIKTRKPDTKACAHFQYHNHSEDLPNRQEVVHFLTTEFLKEILKKTLPPENWEQDECC